MTAIGWLLVVLAVAALIDGYHGHNFWNTLTGLFSAPATKKGG